MNILIMNGSVRPNNYTFKLSSFLKKKFESHQTEVNIIRPEEFNLVDPGLPASEGARNLVDLVEAADAIIFATPEYHGTYSSITKKIIENLNFPSVLKGKKVAIVGCAAGRIGAIKSTEALRGTIAHIGAHALPQAVSVASVQSVFNEVGECQDDATSKYLDGFVDNCLSFFNS